MNRQHSDISGHMCFTQYYTKRSSGMSVSRRERKRENHIWNIYEEQFQNQKPFCMYCQLEFESLVHWHGHMVSFIHKGPVKQMSDNGRTSAEALITCKVCQQEIRIEVVKEHRCCLTEIAKLEKLIKNYNYSYCPLVCILCKTVKVFTNQAYLQIHLVTKHSPLKDPIRCSLCNTQFKTHDVNVHEAHAIDIHGPELNFLYWKLNEILAGKKSKSEYINYPCVMSLYSNRFCKEKNPCAEVMTDVFQLTLHTLCYHGFLPRLSILEMVVKEDEPVLSSFKIGKDECKYCGFQVSGAIQLSQHIQANHSLEMMLRRDFVMRKKLFIGKIPMHLTCFQCVTIFPNITELQVHMMVRHGNEEYNKCGMCSKRFLTSPNDDILSYKMQWRTIQYHETCHLKQFIKFKSNGLFNSLLFPSAVLYKSGAEFEKELQNHKNKNRDILFTDEQIAFFKLLGSNNYESQIKMEMLAN